MKDVYVKTRNFTAGVCEEYNVRRVMFDISEYREAFGDGTPLLLITRPGEEQSYPISPEVEGDYAVWIPRRRDTDIPGTARVVLQWYVDDGLAISTEYYAGIMGEKSAAGEAPETEERWYRDVLQAGADAKAYAADAYASAGKAQDALSDLLEGIASGNFRGDPGPQGMKGDTGAAGKTAYQYAVDGGYAGTETEFAEKLAELATIINGEEVSY